MFGAPPVDGLGNAGGFKIMVEDRGDTASRRLQTQVDNLVEKGNQSPGWSGLFTMFRANTPQLYVDVDRTSASRWAWRSSDVFNTLQVYLGGLLRQRLQPVRPHLAGQLQADAAVPRAARRRRAAQRPQRQRRHGAAGTGGRRRRPQRPGAHQPLQHATPAAAINGDWTPGVSSGQAIRDGDAGRAGNCPAP